MRRRGAMWVGALAVVAILGFGGRVWSGSDALGHHLDTVEHTASQFSSRAFAVRPDGRAIALSLDGEIWVLKPDVDGVSWFGRLPLGTDLTRLTRGAESVSGRLKERWIHRLPTWLPDGRLAYFRSIKVEDPDSEGPVDRELWISGLQGLRKLAELPPSRQFQLVLPDPGGTHLLLLEGSAGISPKERLWLLDLRTGGLRSLPTEELPAAPAEAVWSPDGKAIALAVPTKDWLHLYRLDIADGTLERLTAASTPVDAFLAPPALVWPTGSDSLLVHLWEPASAPGSVPKHAGIWSVPAASGAHRQVVKPLAGLFSPQWSPDGRWVAYHNRNDGYRYALDVKSGRSYRLGGWNRPEPVGILFQWEGDSHHVWYPCPSGLCRALLPPDPRP